MKETKQNEKTKKMEKENFEQVEGAKTENSDSLHFLFHLFAWCLLNSKWDILFVI